MRTADNAAGSRIIYYPYLQQGAARAYNYFIQELTVDEGSNQCSQCQMLV